MTKNTMGNKLPRKLEQKMQIVGEQIKLARLRRNLSIAQIADQLGYKHATHFTAAFKKNTGELPKEFQKQNR